MAYYDNVHKLICKATSTQPVNIKNVYQPLQLHDSDAAQGLTEIWVGLRLLYHTGGFFNAGTGNVTNPSDDL